MFTTCLWGRSGRLICGVKPTVDLFRSTPVIEDRRTQHCRPCWFGPGAGCDYTMHSNLAATAQSVSLCLPSGQLNSTLRFSRTLAKSQPPAPVYASGQTTTDGRSCFQSTPAPHQSPKINTFGVFVADAANAFTFKFGGTNFHFQCPDDVLIFINQTRLAAARHEQSACE
jgi:hypothetical protein